MKKLVVLSLIILSMSACTQRTCPTYAQEDIKKEVKQEQANA